MTRKPWMLAALLLLAARAPAPAAAAEGLHAPWDRLLKAHVRARGHVSYAGFRRDERELDAYLATLAATDPKALTREGRLALWINAYNAFTVKLILKKYPDIASIRDFWSPWKGHVWRVGGEDLTLDHIEHGILRKQFAEPRIHFAIVCASGSCPDLLDEAYVPERLEEQLAAATRRFLANRSKGLRVATEKGALWGTSHNVYLSSLFSWFGEDFVEKSGSVLAFVRPLAPPEAQAFMAAHEGDLTVKFLDYDWSLNGD